MNTDKSLLEAQNQPSCLGAVISRFIYLITNESDGIVESAWSNFEEAKKECKQWEKMKRAFRLAGCFLQLHLTFPCFACGTVQTQNNIYLITNTKK